MPMVDIDWLKDHVEVPEGLTYEQLAKDLVKVGLEEEEIHTSQVTGPIVVGYVVDATPEPQKNGKIINWCHVDVGDEYNETDENGNKVPRGIICGAPNMAAGEKVVVTLPGAVLPGDFKIEPRKTYGHISNGMCASERELGLGDNHDGIILLRKYGFTPEEYEKLQPGDDAMHLLHLDQPLLEINITPDRGYAFSYRGVAREYHHSTGAVYTDPATALGKKAPVTQGLPEGVKSDIEVIVDDKNPIHGVVGCDRYYARAVRGFDPASHTPNWMRRRLIRAGMRSISLAVDVTNYVMLDLGQPMHAYDLDKIEGPIVVRRANEGEKLTTLDGKDHDLSVEDLLITDSPNGERGSRVLGIAGVMGGLYGEVTAETKNILLESAHFDQVSIARSARRHKIPSEASRRFERGVDDQLQPAAAQMAAELLVKYGNGEPSEHPTDYNTVCNRRPILFKASEVARVAGLDTDVNTISDILTDIGCTVAGGGTKKVSVEIANPLAGDRPFLRRDIIPTLAQTVQRNLRRGVENVSLYEIGHVYLWDPNAPAIPALPGAVKPTDEQLAALDAGLPDQPMHVAGILTGNAVDSIGAKLTLDQPKAEDVPAQWHPGRAARVMAGDTFVGMVGELHPHVNEALGFPAHSAAFELNLTALFATLSGKPVQAKPISTFPPVKQDLAFTVSTDVTAAELEKTIVEAAGNSLESIDLFDVYTGDQLGEGLKSLAYAVTFRAEDKTLTSEDSEAIRKRIVDAAAKLGAQLRA